MITALILTSGSIGINGAIGTMELFGAIGGFAARRIIGIFGIIGFTGFNGTAGISGIIGVVGSIGTLGRLEVSELLGALARSDL